MRGGGGEGFCWREEGGRGGERNACGYTLALACNRTRIIIMLPMMSRARVNCMVPASRTFQMKKQMGT